MSSEISKNARKGTGAEKLACKCGGEIKVISVAVKGNKLKHVARCNSCGAEARKPKDLF